MCVCVCCGPLAAKRAILIYCTLVLFASIPEGLLFVHVDVDKTHFEVIEENVSNEMPCQRVWLSISRVVRGFRQAAVSFEVGRRKWRQARASWRAVFFATATVVETVVQPMRGHVFFI